MNGYMAIRRGPLKFHRGGDNYESKLTDETAMLARACPAVYGAAIRLARSIGVSSSLVIAIRQGKRWKHLPPATQDQKAVAVALDRALSATPIV